jgi:D-glycero-alpha-D-manno-heptose-7-phosphate kinase
MIITKTPYRISFFGGGTDYPEWYLQEGGAVLSTSIDKYCYISCRTLPGFFELKHRIVWSHIEAVGSIAEILHPAVRGGLRMLGFDDTEGLEIHHQGDLPARAGMGSSGSFAVGLIKALSAHRGRMIEKHELAMKAIELEHDVLKENVGSQDQVAAAYGGFNLIRFREDGEIRVSPVTVPRARLQALERKLLLFYTGTSRLSSEVAASLVRGLRKRADQLRHMRRMVDEALAIVVEQGDLDELGRMLHEGWMLKRELSDVVSSPKVDAIYEQALKAGAIGGKLLGAGGSGFMLFYAPEDRHDHVREALSGLLHVPVGFEHDGSNVIYYNPDL